MLNKETTKTKSDNTEKEEPVLPFKGGLFINRVGKTLSPDPTSDEWNEYLTNIAQTSMVIYKLFGIPDLESHKDYMGIVTIAINSFMLKTPEEKAAYANFLTETYAQKESGTPKTSRSKREV